MPRKILVVAAHADDEVLGCGGTIARHTKKGDEVYIIFMADGVTSRAEYNENELKGRHQAAEKAKNILGIHSIQFLGFPDNRMDSLPLIDIIKPLEDIICKIQPEIIYTHHHGDLNIDHRLTHQAVLTACRPQPNFCVKKIYSFEVISSTEWQTPGVNSFIPNVFVDISEFINIKVSALDAYCSEMRATPHARSIDAIRHLANYRGNSVGVNAAESFVLIRELI